METNHDHNGINSPKLTGRSFVNAPFPAVTDPSGGVTIDQEARDTIIEVLDILRSLQIIRE